MKELRAKKICPLEYTLAKISGKWKILIVKELSSGPVRYGEMMRRIPTISSKILINHLRELEDDGLVIRTIYPEVPPRVEYSLSERGLSIITIFLELRRWGLEAGAEENVECNLCNKCVPYIEEDQKKRKKKAGKKRL